jgi:hypothetical protein
MRTYSLVLLFFSFFTVQHVIGGNWQVIQSPNGSNSVNELHGISALAENDIWAVGVSYNSNRTLSSSLVEHWDGTKWSVVPSPNPSGTLNVLYAVAAVAANDVWAVGFAPTSSGGAVIMRWDGGVWSVVPNPPAGIVMSNLMALAVVAPNDIWAVGSGRIGDEDATLTLHWNGSVWNFVSSPNVGPEVNNTLSGAAAVATGDVWAVGTQQPTSLTDPHTLALHWDGASWSIVPSPNDGGSTVGNHLLAASATGVNDVWSTGYSERGTLSEHWDGSSWSVIATPTDANGSEPLFLFGVVALANNNVWTVGESFDNRKSLSHTLTEQWNGLAWSVTKSPNVGRDHNELFAIDAAPAKTLWAVGTVYHFPQQRTLIERKLP